MQVKSALNEENNSLHKFMCTITHHAKLIGRNDIIMTSLRVAFTAAVVMPASELHFTCGKAHLLLDPVGIVMDCRPVMNVEIMAKLS